MLRDRLRSNRRICRVDFATFAAILAAIFALLPWATSSPHHGLSVNLPKASYGVLMTGAQREDALQVVVMRDGQIFVDTQRVSSEELASKLRARVHAGAPKTVYIRADAHARYHTVANVLDSIRSAGLTNVAFLTEQRRPGNQ